MAKKRAEPRERSVPKQPASQDKRQDKRQDKPWLFRTYSGHSSARASNALFHKNLKRGQTGLSVAFDLPTQTGYDSDHPLARGEVGKVGVPICHLGDMRALMDGIPLARMNTSMTINATAPWLLALYVAAAEKQGVKRTELAGTVQNDIIKEYLSRGTYIFPPQPSMRLTTDVIAFTYREIPQWNPVNVCSYHLQEAGATPVQELAFTLATAIAMLDCVRESGQVPAEDFPRVVGRISFFVNAGIRFITELCKMRAFVDLWDQICRDRYGIDDPKYRRFRYGVQVNSLGLTAQQPENNVYRILLEMLAVVLSKDARARAIQLPAWNEALGLPRSRDQQWSLRLQQIVAYETDLLEYDDIFRGSEVIAARVEELKQEARAELERIEAAGGAIAAVESSYMKQKLVESNAARLAAIESGERVIVGVNAFEDSEPSPLADGGDGGFLAIDPKAEEEQVAALEAWRGAREAGRVEAALADLAAAAKQGRNIMEPSISCAHAGVTTGEWAEALRGIFGAYRAPTGVGAAAISPGVGNRVEAVRRRVEEVSSRLGRRIRMLVGKPGLDGHSSGAEQVAVRACDCGIDVTYQGIRLTPAEIVRAALEEDVQVVGLSILSGSHVALVTEVLEGMKESGLGHVPVVVGGIIPPADAEVLKAAGAVAVYTPKDYDLTAIIADIVEIVDRETQAAA
ncbi:MAG: protein meaA [Proteobacteria bacterium]|nr:protein meaA [Pseudomonadota bacterium]